MLRRSVGKVWQTRARNPIFLTPASHQDDGSMQSKTPSNYIIILLYYYIIILLYYYIIRLLYYYIIILLYYYITRAC